MKVLSKPLFTDLGSVRPNAKQKELHGHSNQTASCAQFFVKSVDYYGVGNRVFTGGALLQARGENYNLGDEAVQTFIDTYSDLGLIYSDYKAYRDRKKLGAEHVRVDWINDKNAPGVATSYNDVEVVEKPDDHLQTSQDHYRIVSLYLPNLYASIARKQHNHALGNPATWEGLHGADFEVAIAELAQTKVTLPLPPPGVPPLEAMLAATHEEAQAAAPKLKRQTTLVKNFKTVFSELAGKLPSRVRSTNSESSEKSLTESDAP